MKKLIVPSLVAVALFSLAACATEATHSTTTTSQQTTVPGPTTTTTTDTQTK
jgi:curli biogenesis system outer membrane secretion channel CsgG